MSGALAACRSVRRQGWFSPVRTRGYGLLVAAYALAVWAVLTFVYLHWAWQDPHGRSLLTDFTAFWAAARLALHGQPGQVYIEAAIRAQEMQAAQADARGTWFPFLYPPTFLLLCLPFGALPYLTGLAAFVLGGTAALVAALRAVLPRGWPLLTLIGCPAVVINAVSTQNGCLSAACFGGALLTLDRRPLVGGACLGMLAFKPHLGLAIPVALLAARRWRALLACAAAACGLIACSWAVLGPGVWVAFVHALPEVRRVSDLPNVWATGMSVKAAGLILGAPSRLAYALQAGCALAALPWLCRICAARPGAGAEVSALVCATFLCTPYVMDYDLVCLAVPMAWLAATALAECVWRPWERAVLVLAYPFPLAARALAMAGLPLAPLVVAALLGLLVARSGGKARPSSVLSRRRPVLWTTTAIPADRQKFLCPFFKTDRLPCLPRDAGVQ